MIDRFVAAVVRAPFGLKGYVKVQSLSGEVDHLVDLEEALLRKDGREKRLQVEDTGGSPTSFTMKFSGIDDPEAAKALAGWELLVDREDAAPLDENEFYIEDLRGLSVLFAGEPVGEIVDVVEGGGGQLVELRLLAGGATRLVPFRDEFFGDIDTGARKAVLRVDWILE